MHIVTQLKKLFIKKPKIIVVLGATSTGKSDIAVEIAQRYNGEVISADSRQVYRGMDLGSGKITVDETMGIPHHLLDVTEPMERFSAHDFKTLGAKALHEILEKNKVPIICGGTGFYIDTLVSHTRLAQVAANQELRDEYNQKTLDELQDILQEKSSHKEYQRIDIQNKVRVIRSLEIIESLGYLPKNKSFKPYNVLYIGLDVPRDDLYKLIQKRLEKRIQTGMITEVETLLKNGVSHERLESFGLEYKHVSRFIQGLVSKEEMIEDIYTDSKRFVKRQKTWFKRNKEIHWFNPLENTNILYKEIDNFLR